MIFIFYFFAAALVFLSYRSFRGGIEYLNFFKREIAKQRSDFMPFASIIAPCRGLDEDLEENLSALFRQSFKRYEVIFVVDSEYDEAVGVIQKVSRQAAAYATSKLVVAGKSESESQKVHNLREAVLHAASDSKVFVFVDSDARPVENWLRNLIAPLADEKVGAATAYRWFISKKFSFASEMRAVWNASIASALGANLKSNFCWGGSMAVRRETFEEIGIREKWRGTVSDDFVVTRAMKEAGLQICFVPQALMVSVENCNWRECLEFTTRQMKITRVYAADLWIQSFIGAGLFNLVWVWGIVNLFFYSISFAAFWLSLASLISISVFSIGKSRLRSNAVRLVLHHYGNELDKQFWTQNTLWIFSPALFFYNSFCALLSRQIVWRGIKYELRSPNQTTVFNRQS